MKTLGRSLLSFGVALLMAAACGGTTSSGGDSETHWLKACTASRECGPGACLCGLCTVECTVGQSCKNGPPGSTCFAGSAAAVCESASTVPGGLCLTHSGVPISDGGPLVADSGPHDGGPSNDAGPTFAQSSAPRSVPDYDGGAVASAVEANREFALTLYQSLRTTPGNVFFSPFSITAAMAMTWAGAQGTTASEIAHVFNFSSSAAETHQGMNALLQELTVNDPSLTTDFANTFWVNADFTPLPAYLNTLATYYGAGVGLVNFSNPTHAAAVIDEWVLKKTHGAVPTLLTPADLSGGVKSVLTNAVYFNALWNGGFDKSATQDADFHLADGTKKTVKLMDHFATVPYVATAQYQAASVPFVSREGRTDSMIFILPSGDLSLFEYDFGGTTLGTILRTMRTTDVELRIPRTKISARLDLRDTLSAMGMPTAFAQGADFSAMGNPVPWIFDVIHAATLSVDEAGAEATGATAVIFGLDGGASLDAGPPPPVLRLDRPFLVLIRNGETGTIMFMGRVADPTP